MPEQKLLTIPDFVDTDLYRPLPRDNASAKQHGLIKDFIVMYGGNVGIAKNIRILGENEELRIQMGINGRNFIKEQFNWNQYSKEYENIIDTLLKNAYLDRAKTQKK